MKNTLQVTENAVVSMTSLEIVEFINSRRPEGSAELRHADFLGKVLKVLGLEYSENFRSTYVADNGKENPCYRFPKRESMLMAMSYDYAAQAAIYDRWQELETKIRLPAKTKIRLPAETSAELQAEVSAVTKALLYVSKQVEDLTRIHTPSLQVKTLSNWNNEHRKTLAKLQCDVANLKSRLAQTKMSPDVTQQIKDNLEWVLLQQGSAYELALVELIMRNDQYEQATRKYNDLKAGILRISYSCSPSQTCADLTKLYNENP